MIVKSVRFCYYFIPSCVGGGNGGGDCVLFNLALFCLVLFVLLKKLTVQMI